RKDPITEIIARRIIEAAQTGLRSRLALRDGDKRPQSSLAWIRNELPLPSLNLSRGAPIAIAPMRDYSPRSSYESDNVPWQAVARRAVRAMIGQELRARYEVPQDLPHEMLAFLV